MSNSQYNSTAVLEPEVLATPGQLSKSDRAKDALRGNPWKIFAGLAVLIVALAVGSKFLLDAYLHEDTDDAQIDGHIMPLSSRINGQVAEVRVEQGQFVHAGDILAVIDPADYNIAVAQAEARLADAKANAASSHFNVPITAATAGGNLDSARAGVINADAGIKAAQRNLESAQAALEEAEANAAKTDADLVRYKALVAKEDISRQQYDQAVAAAKANRAAVASAKAAALSAEQSVRQAQGRQLQADADLRSAKTAPEQVSTTHARADSADAQVREHAAELAQAQLNLSYTVVRSPVTGIVGKKSVEAQQNVGVGQELFSVIPLDDIWVTANFKETQLAHMRAGQEVEIKVDAYGRTWKGHLSNLGGGTGSVFSLLPPENATGNYVKVVQRVPVRIDFDRNQMASFNADGLLRPGMSVDASARVR
jgi:membrane fusion protein (multidrug efflux system)